MNPEAIAIAEAHAARDKATLARLVAEGKVMYLPERVKPHRPVRNVNLAIRPKQKKRGKR